MKVLSTFELTRRYGSRLGIDGVNLEVAEGSLFGFLGPNGAGKTTTIRILLGFLEPTSGSAEVFGLDCWRNSATIKKQIGYVPGDLRLYTWMNGHAALRILSGIHGRDLTKKGAELAERFRLDMSVHVHKMSRGTRQKLGLIMALVHEPRLAILDEPTSGLDPLMQDELSNLLRDMAANGHTVFFSSHTLSEVEQLCDHIAIVREGRIVANESLRSLRERARRTVTLLFDNGEAAGVDVPPFLRILDRGGRQWRCELAGESSDLIRWAATRSIEDMTIGSPNLESLFRQYYTTESESEAS